MKKKATPSDIMNRIAKIRGDWINIVLTTNGPVIEGIIHGVLASKSNSRNVAIVHREGRKPQRIPIIEPAAAAFLKRFDAAARAAGFGKWGTKAPVDGRFSIRVVVFQKDLRRDLDIELLCDALQKSGVITNDRKIWDKQSRRVVDRENPRVEFRVVMFDENEKALV
jgi:hypothetical protein